MIINFLAPTLPFEATQAAALPVALDRIAVIILAGGEGKRLEPLTKSRCKPALTFGGKYSLIDVPISHALSTGLKKIYVIGQYMANTLQEHLFHTYLHHGILQQELHMLVPEEREGRQIWYKGTADAIRQNLTYFAQIPADYFLILSGDQLYNINFQDMIRFGVEHDASMVIAAQPINEKEARRMGVLKLQHGDSKLIDFYEKPQEQEIIDQYAIDQETLSLLGYDPHMGKKHLGSMGIYLFKRQALFQLLKEDEGVDFGKHLITSQMNKGNAHVYLYDGYWEDIGTIESYYHANLALTTRDNDDRQTGFQCYNENSPIIMRSSYLPSAKIRNTHIQDAIICDGTIIEANEIRHSIIGQRSIIRKGTTIRDSILLGNESYQRMSVDGKTNSFIIGENCLITKTIIDENVSIGNNVHLVNKERHVNFDSPQGLFVRDGIIVVPRGTRLPDRFVF